MKKIIVFGVALLILFVGSINAAGKVEVLKSKVSLFKSAKHGKKDKPVYVAKKGEILNIVSTGKSVVKVKSVTGATGWVKKSSVKPIGGSTGGKKKFVMDEAKVLGYLENPQAVYILDMSDPNFKPIKLNRSFSDRLGGNIDKETNQRMYDNNLSPEK